MDLAGQVAVVTGGASGIGRGIALAIARRGARVIIADIELDRAQVTAAELQALSLEAHALPLDVADQAAWTELAEIADGLWEQPVTLLFNNAGVGAGGQVHSTPRKTWDWIFAVNLMGVYSGVTTFAPRMLAHCQTARIINTGSEHALGLPPTPRGGVLAPYTAAKHAVMGYSLCMRRDFEGTCLSAAIICPGLVQSDIWNAFRNRQPQFGGPRQAPPAFGAANAGGLPAETAGERIADQVEADSFFIFTNGPDEAEVLSDFTREAGEAMSAFRSRYGV